MAYLLTISRTDFSKRKAKWADPHYKATTRRIGQPDALVPHVGFVVQVDDEGSIVRSEPLWSPKGMLVVNEKLLVACHSTIEAFSLDFRIKETFVDDFWCNDLHSLRASARGFLVAASGVDAVFELSPEGGVQWSWWAAEHEYPTNMSQEVWDLGTTKDHRSYLYPVERQSTHVNAITELDHTTLVATLLHRDALIRIDRTTGQSSVVLGNLGRPHAVRSIGDGLVTLADTTSGQALVIKLDGLRSSVVSRVQADTSWLHDAYFNGENWMLVDGANSRVIHADAYGLTKRVDQFDTDWCLYEVLPWE